MITPTLLQGLHCWVKGGQLILMGFAVRETTEKYPHIVGGEYIYRQILYSLHIFETWKIAESGQLTTPHQHRHCPALYVSFNERATELAPHIYLGHHLDCFV